MSHDSQLVLQQVLDHARKLCGKLPEAEKAKLDEVLNELSDPQVCWAKFLSEGYTKVDGPIDEDDDADQVDCAELPQTYLASVKEKFNKATGSMLDLLLQVMSGKFLQDCRSLATATTTFAQALAVAADGEGQDNCELVKQFQVVLMQFEGNSKSVVALTGSVPAAQACSLLSTARKMRMKLTEHGNGRVSRQRGRDSLLFQFQQLGQRTPSLQPSVAQGRCSVTKAA